MNSEVIYTAVTKENACIKIIGKGNFLNSLPVKNWLLSKLQEGYSGIIIDLGNCKSMDSTFMGAITGFSLRMKRLVKEPLVLADITAHNKRLLETLGLDKFFVFKERIEDAKNISWQQLTFASLNKLETTQHMMESHEELLDSSKEAKKEFGAVHDMIKKDLERQLEKKKDNNK